MYKRIDEEKLIEAIREFAADWWVENKKTTHADILKAVLDCLEPDDEPDEEECKCLCHNERVEVQPEICKHCCEGREDNTGICRDCEIEEKMNEPPTRLEEIRERVDNMEYVEDISEPQRVKDTLFLLDKIDGLAGTLKEIAGTWYRRKSYIMKKAQEALTKLDD